MLISCPECNRQVSDQAINCPGCGMPLENVKARQADPRNQVADAAAPIVKSLSPIPAVQQLGGGQLVCPSCSSTDVRSQRVVHAEGKSSGSGLSGGILSNLKGGIGLATGHSSVSMQSDLSRHCEPPEENDFDDLAIRQVGDPPSMGYGLMIGICFGIIAVPLIIAVATPHDDANTSATKVATQVAAGIGGFIALGFVVWLFIVVFSRANKKNAWRALVAKARQELHSKAMHEYDKSFICLKCGHQFLP